MSIWRKDLSDEELDRLFEDSNQLEKVPDSLDHKVQLDIKSFIKEKEAKKKPFYFSMDFSFLFKPVFAGALAVIIMIPILLFIFTSINTSLQLKPCQLSGSITLSNEGNQNQQAISLDSHIRNTQMIKTDSQSRGVFAMKPYLDLFINSDTRVRVDHLKKNSSRFNLKLDRGEIVANLKNLDGKQFIITTRQSIVTVTGTQLLVNVDKEGNDLVAVKEGQVAVQIKNSNNETRIVKSGEMIVIKGEKFVGQLSINRQVTESFAYLEDHRLPADENPSGLNLQTGLNHCILILNDKETARFNDKVQTLILPGEYHLTVKCEGYEDYHEKISLAAGETLKLAVQLKQKVISQEERWYSKKVYQIKKTGNAESKVLGFVLDQNQYYVQTETAVFCLNDQHQLLWKNDFSSKTDLYFMSLPVIIGQQLLLTSINKKMLVINKNSGEKVREIETQGDLINGYQALLIKNNVLLPLSSGIYEYQTNQDGLKSIMPLNSPTTPLLIGNKIVVASYTENKLVQYDLNGKKGWEYSLKSPTFYYPVNWKNSIVINDNLSSISIIDKKGMLLKEKSMPFTIVSPLTVWEDSVLAAAKDGYLYRINLNNLASEKLFRLNSVNRVEDFLFTKWVILDNMLIAGNQKGDVIFYHLISKKIEQKLSIGPASFIAAIGDPGQILLADQSGSIFNLEKK